MNKNVLSEKLILEKNLDPKYNEKMNLKFDYEINKYTLDDKDLKNSTILTKSNEKVTFLNIQKFNDEIVEKFYRCKEISCLKKSCLKSIISKQKIRFRNNKFDLDLRYKVPIIF